MQETNKIYGTEPSPETDILENVLKNIVITEL